MSDCDAKNKASVAKSLLCLLRRINYVKNRKISVQIPEKVSADNGLTITVKGPKGEPKDLCSGVFCSKRKSGNCYSITTKY